MSGDATKAGASYDDTQYYLISWVRLLHTLLDWSETQVLDWVHTSGFWEHVHDPDDIMFHGSPSYWVRHLLVPEALRAQLPHERWLDLLRDLQGLFAEEDRRPQRDPTAIDWQRFKAPYAQLLAVYPDEAQSQAKPSL
jgi:hypothetical protein